MTQRIIMLLLLVLSLAACTFKKKEPPAYNYEREKLQLMDVDREFSEYSEANGMKTAFMDVLDSNGVLLRPGQMPIIGANAVDYLSTIDDNGYTMKWEPTGASVSRSGDMAYTYGTYSVLPKGIDTVILGTYVHIWKKQSDSSWALVLQTGNDGLGDTTGVRE